MIIKKINLFNLLKLSSLLTIAAISLVSCDNDNEAPITEVEETEQFLSGRSLLFGASDSSSIRPEEPDSLIFNVIFFDEGGASYDGSSTLNTTSGTSTYNQTGNLGILQLDDDTLGIVTISLTFDENNANGGTGLYEATSSTTTENGAFQLSQVLDSFSEQEILSLQEQYIGLTEAEAFELAEDDVRLQGFRVREVDGVGQGLTADFLPRRLNFHIENGIVISISFG